MDLFGYAAPPAPPPDPRWAEFFALVPQQGPEGGKQPSEGHPGPGKGRKPSDHAETERLRCQFLSQENALKLQKIFSKMFNCGFHLKKCDKCGETHFIPRKCGSRLCPFNSRRSAVERVAQYLHLAQKARNPRFLTLTQPLIPYDQPDGLLWGVKWIRKAFYRLTRRKIFNRVWGGIYSIEIVLRPGGFHIHMHVLIDALWVENRNEKGRPLETAWRECLKGVGVTFPESSNGRSILWIEKCDAETMREVLKYTVKSASRKDPPPEEGGSSVHTGQKSYIAEELTWDEVPYEGLKQLVDVLEGKVHMIEPFGSWRGEVKKYLAEQKELGRKAAKELEWCHCGGKLVELSSGPWNDPRLIFVDGKHELRPSEFSLPPTPDWYPKRKRKAE